jgi:transposase InsO family protein
MKDELEARQRAIQLRLAGEPIQSICRLLRRSRDWFHRWWQRYRAKGPDGLFELTRSNHHPRRLAPDLERTILSVRKRIESQTHPGTRYSLIGAQSILAELEALHIRPLPSPRTIERVLQRHGVTLPRIRLAPLVSRYTYPAPQALDSNQVHQVDCIGPIYLRGQRQRHYLWTCKDVFDGAVCLDLSRSRRMEAVLAFLGKCWKTLGRPRVVQFDNAREIVGWGPAARYLSRVLRLCLRFGIEPVLIPPAKPERQGSVENFNGWLQARLFQRHFSRVSALRLELGRLQDAVNTQHIHPRLGGLTPAQYRRQKQLSKLPPRYTIPMQPVPLAAGRVTFIRQVTPYGNIHLLSQSFKVGKRLKGQYVKAVLDTQRHRLTVYLNGRVLKRWPYPYLKS